MPLVKPCQSWEPIEVRLDFKNGRAVVYDIETGDHIADTAMIDPMGRSSQGDRIRIMHIADNYGSLIRIVFQTISSTFLIDDEDCAGNLIIRINSRLGVRLRHSGYGLPGVNPDPNAPYRDYCFKLDKWGGLSCE